MTGSHSGNIFIYRGQIDGTFMARETLLGADGQPFNIGLNCSIAVTDWDADGDLDLLAGVSSKTAGNERLFFVPNVGGKDGIRPGNPVPLTAKGAGDDLAPTPCVADWDVDGIPDLLIGSRTGRVLFYKATRSGTGLPKLADPVLLVTAGNRDERDGFIKTPETVSFSGQYAKVCVTDWNGDGLPDLVLGNFLQVSFNPDLTEAQKQDRTLMEQELNERKTCYQTRFSEVETSVRKELGLDDVRKKMSADEERKYRTSLTAQLNTEELLELRKRIRQLEEALRPLTPGFPVHGYVWVFLRKAG